MEKTVFKIRQMDCSAEEQLVRMQLEPIEAVTSLRFDLNQRMLTIYHDGSLEKIGSAISRLNLGSAQLSTELVDETIEINSDHEESRLLWIVLLINAAFFVGEFTFGILANSMGLVADSLDMLAGDIVKCCGSGLGWHSQQVELFRPNQQQVVAKSVFCHLGI